MFCPHCGGEVPGTARFCPHCGKGLGGVGKPLGQLQVPPAMEASARQVARKLTEVRNVIRLGAGVALFALLFLPQVSCMGQSMTATGLLNLARDFDAMTGARDLFLWFWILSVFGGAVWALVAPNRLAGWVAGLVQLLFIMRIAGAQGLRLALGAYVALAGFALVAFAPQAAIWARGFAAQGAGDKGHSSGAEPSESKEPRNTPGAG